MGPKWIALACVAALAGSLAGCEPLYGGKPEHLRNPERKKKPPDAPDSGVQVKYVEDCSASMTGDPKLVRRQTAVANNLVGDGDTALQSSQHATDPAAAGGFVKDAIDKYRNALVKDPYNVDATLKLAEAYDLVLRKGCALAMLRRIAQLSNHPSFQKPANASADEVAQNPSLFKGYRKDAVAAVGR
jgi:hypothetical protein